MEAVLEAAKNAAEQMRNMPSRVKWHALIAVCLAFAFYAIIVCPASAKLRKLKKAADGLQKQIELQTKLLPLYAELKTVSELRILKELSQTVEKPMSKSDVQDLCAKLAASARKSGALVVSAIPQPNLKSGVVNFVPVDVVVKGRYPDIRGFLLDASTLQGFDSISHVTITREADRERLEARIWVIVE